jgi:hypothetical protein
MVRRYSVGRATPIFAALLALGTLFDVVTRIADAAQQAFSKSLRRFSTEAVSKQCKRLVNDVVTGGQTPLMSI